MHCRAPGDGLAVSAFYRALLVDHAFGDALAHVLGDEIVILGLINVSGGLYGH
jgi:hypothetical protein